MGGIFLVLDALHVVYTIRNEVDQRITYVTEEVDISFCGGVSMGSLPTVYPTLSEVN